MKLNLTKEEISQVVENFFMNGGCTNFIYYGFEFSGGLAHLKQGGAILLTNEIHPEYNATLTYDLINERLGQIENRHIISLIIETLTEISDGDADDLIMQWILWDETIFG